MVLKSFTIYLNIINMTTLFQIFKTFFSLWNRGCKNQNGLSQLISTHYVIKDLPYFSVKSSFEISSDLQQKAFFSLVSRHVCCSNSLIFWCLSFLKSDPLASLRFIAVWHLWKETHLVFASHCAKERDFSELDIRPVLSLQSQFFLTPMY